MKGVFTYFLIFIVWNCAGQTFPELKFVEAYSKPAMPKGGINAMVMDHDGLLWLTTPTGLMRYDGVNLKQMIAPAQCLSSLHSIVVDADNELYIGSASGLIRYNIYQNKFRTYIHNPKDSLSLADDDKPTPFVDSKNRIWITTTKGLQLFDPATHKFRKYKVPPPVGLEYPTQLDHLGNMTEDNAGRLWICSAFGIYMLENPNSALVLYPNNKIVSLTGLLPDQKGNIYTFTWGEGMKVFNHTTKTFSAIPFNDGTVLTTPSHYTDVDGNNWIAFTNGPSFFLYNPVNGRYKNYDTNDDSEFKWKGLGIYNIYRDPLNNLWIATDYGLYTLNHAQQIIKSINLHKIVHVPKKHFGVPNYFDRQGNENWVLVWFSQGFYRFTQDWKLISHTEMIPPKTSDDPSSRDIRYFHKDDTDDVWFTTNAALVRWHKGVYTSYIPKEDQFGPMIESANFRTITPDGKGHFYVRSLKNGIFIFDKATKTFINKIKPEEIDYSAGQVFDSDSRLWFGTNIGLYVYRPTTGALKHIPLTDSRISNHKLINYVLDIKKGSGDTLWIATFGGLYNIDTRSETISYAGTTESVDFKPMSRLCFDPKGNIWAASTESIIAYLPETKTFRKFASDAGLPASLDVDAFTRNMDGEIYVSLRGGIIHFDPEQLLRLTMDKKTKLVITDIVADGSNLPSGDNQFHIKSGVASLKINFTLTNYIFPQQNRLYYRLMTGKEDIPWIMTGGEIDLVNLPPGTHTLQLKGENLNLPGDPILAEYKLTVDPKWFQTKLFFVIGNLILGGILFLLVRYRIKTVKSRAKIKQQIAETEIAALKAQMNPHFMFNCLNSIDAFIHTNDKYNATLYLNKFGKLMRHILDSSIDKVVPLAKDIATIELYIELEQLRFSNKFQYQLTIEKGINTEEVMVPPLIIQPYVENAIKHGLANKKGDGGLLKIDIKRAEHAILLEISDNGVGMANATLKSKPGTWRSHGLDISRERIRLFNDEKVASVKISYLTDHPNDPGTFVSVTLNTNT